MKIIFFQNYPGLSYDLKNNGLCITDETIEKLLANTDFFEKEGKKRVKEELRRGKPKKLEDVFGGIEGSFKKLDID